MGIMIANFFWSTFLHATSVKTTEATLNKEQVIQQASSTVSGIVETNACMARTNKKILNNNFKIGTEFSSEDSFFGETNYTKNKEDIRVSVDKVHECLRYYIEPVENSDEIITAYSIKRPEILVCTGYSKIDGLYSITPAGMLINATVDQINTFVEYGYNENSYGAKHNCGTMVYNAPKIQNMFADNEDSKLFSDLNARDQIKLVRGNYLSLIHI